jgi:hypothetical protein
MKYKDEERFKLCYVDLPWCYFTTQELGKQWGDDWNDAPYEHNAGPPYTGDGWEIRKVAIDAELSTPRDGYTNSPFSVEQINGGAIAWLYAPSWADNPNINIHAGTTLPEFRKQIALAGGKVYEET